ncbi:MULTISPECIES: hypothetical protein [Streptomyces]|uniref:hypothetical protein n=1 Tax=Streptomyces TaxID=1883 RepID=UPI00206C1BFB|nr:MULTISPECIES: hypothetical protein [Streptomyces]UPT45410.1 hypothetical protein MWG59_30860 [Streptomyces sp. WAC00303]WIY79547.1 hypothetical protein QPM16_30565 [Streptomyces anulatus]
MTTNRGRKDVIRDRMAATGESYNVAARNLKAMKDMGATREAVLVQRWKPADSLDVPCPCGGTCEPGETCDHCHARHRHVKRYPGSTTEVETWADRYECTGCSSSYTLTIHLAGRPWGVAETVVQGGSAEEVVRARVFPGVIHPLLRSEAAEAGGSDDDGE